MCGIGGIYYPDGKPVDSGLLEKMAVLTRYRGPDDQGFFRREGIGFFHNRLSVIDLTTGHQPLCNEDESIWVTYNGEIYNYPELRDELSKKGHVFRTRSDTEVIVHLYEEYGFECLQYLNGMFAFAIWDEKEKRLFAARDRLGIKPLYYYYDGNMLVFGSEAKVLALHPQVEVSLHYPGLLDYLTFQYTLNDKTMFTGIKKLLPGHYMTISNDRRLQIQQFWDIDVGNFEEDSFDGWAEKLQGLLRDSVRLRLRSDVPLGAHLSGGVDSGSLVCLASEMLDQKVKTFSAGFSEGGVFHDLDYCQITSMAAGTEHFEITPNASDFAHIIPQLVWQMDEPAAAEGIFPQYYVSRLASERVKVVLGGQGSDEILGGYTRYYLMYLEAALKKEIFGGGDELGMSLDDLTPQLSQLQKYQPLMKSFFSEDMFGESDRRYYNLIRRSKIEELLSKDILNAVSGYSPFEEYRQIFNRKANVPLLERILYYETKTSLTALLQVEDRTSMAVSLESRVPFLDHRIVELAFKMPPRIKFFEGQMKHILKRAMRKIVPDPILDRPDKLGFPVPLGQWSQNQLKVFINDLLLNGELVKSGLIRSGILEKYTAGNSAFDRTLWGLINFELWLRLFIKGEGFSRFAAPVPYQARLSLS